jgi:glycerate kinase
VLHASLGGSLVDVSVSGPLGEPVEAQLLLVGATAYLEAAQACGLHLVPEPERDPTVTTTYGVGELLTAALQAGAREVVVGLGGSATNDAGAGLLAALGATATDTTGGSVTSALRQGGLALRDVAAVDLTEPRRRLAGVRLRAASDVDNPLLGLRGATNGYGPQKGASEEQVMQLEGALAAFAAAVGRGEDGKDPAVALGAGAAGGLGYALLALGGERVPGTASVLAAVDLPGRVARADLVVTGEGGFDWQSLRGKVVAGVAAVALEHGRPCLVLAGTVDVDPREYAPAGVSGALSVVDDLASRGLPAQAAYDDPAARLADLAERAARTWSA